MDLFRLMAEEQYLIQLIEAVLFQKRLPAPDTEIDFKLLCHIAGRSSLNGFLYDGFKRACYEVSPEILNMSLDTRNRVMAREAVQEVEIQRIFQKFEDAEIYCIPMKGYLLKNLYPQPYMRLSVDVDLLCDPGQMKQVEQIMYSLQYTLKHRAECHDVYTKAPNLTVEMHSKLFRTPSDWNRFPPQAWNRAVPYQNYRYIRQFTLEDCYCYTLMHTGKHLRMAGIGLHSALDQFLFLVQYADRMDWAQVQACLKRFRLEKLHQYLLELGPALFPESKTKISFFQTLTYQCDPKDLMALCAYLFRSGAGGTVQNIVNFQLMRKPQKDDSFFAHIKYMFSRAFPSRKRMECLFPKLEKTPLLLQVFWCIRLIQTVSCRSKYLTAEMKAVKSFNQQEAAQLKELYEKLGL